MTTRRKTLRRLRRINEEKWTDGKRKYNFQKLGDNGELFVPNGLPEHLLALDEDGFITSVLFLSDWLYGTGGQIVVTPESSGGAILSLSAKYIRLFASKTIDSTDSPYSVLVTDGTIFIDATGGNIVINHISAVGIDGESFQFKRIDDSGNTVTVNADGAEAIDNDSSFNMFGLEPFKTTSDNSNWWLT
ncbi:MAG: hypothetical protein KAJ10_03580 [Thermodesulfovibrionia bacterium]|nr:hypothetical protein [Thermodesulfovibrionia bacterium]